MLKGHAGRFSCEYCEAEGECIDRKICYPLSTMKQPKRTHAKWLQCVTDLELEREQDGSVQSNKGVTGRSPLLKIRNFDIVKKAPSDPFHRDWLGICKATLWRHTVGLSKGGNMSATGRRICDYIGDIYREIDLPSEFSHRSRPVDYANFKGHEWKAMAVSCFPSICHIVEHEIEHAAAHVWLLFIFLVLIYNGPQWARTDIGDDYLETLHELLYEQFQDAFGEASCTFNWHSFSHMPDISKFGRPIEMSTEPYESAYGEVQVAYKSGTRNIGLQIVNNMLVKRLNHRQGRCCKNELTIAPRERDVRYNDSLVMDEHYNYYKVIRVENELMSAQRLLTKDWSCPTDTNVPMRYVGVCKYVKIEATETLLRTSDIVGKAIVTGNNVIIPFYKDLLFS